MPATMRVDIPGRISPSCCLACSQREDVFWDYIPLREVSEDVICNADVLFVEEYCPPQPDA